MLLILAIWIFFHDPLKFVVETTDASLGIPHTLNLPLRKVRCIYIENAPRLQLLRYFEQLRYHLADEFKVRRFSVCHGQCKCSIPVHSAFVCNRERSGIVYICTSISSVIDSAYDKVWWRPRLPHHIYTELSAVCRSSRQGDCLLGSIHLYLLSSHFATKRNRLPASTPLLVRSHNIYLCHVRKKTYQCAYSVRIYSIIVAN